MKTFYFLIFLLQVSKFGFSQPKTIKAYTGKAYSLNLSAQPISYLRDERDHKLKQSFDLSLSTKVGKGFYPTIGYTRIQKFYDYQSVKESTFNTNVLTTSFMTQKKFLTLKDLKAFPYCHTVFLSLLFGPEYNYAITQNRGYKGEVAIKLGFSLFAIRSGVRNRVFIWDLFYRKGLTPIIYNQWGRYKRDEIGVQFRLLKRQTYSFY